MELIMNFINEYLAPLGGVGVLIAIAAFLSKKLVMLTLDKDIAEYKSGLDQELTEHRIRMEEISSDRHDALKKIYRHALEVECLCQEALRIGVAGKESTEPAMLKITELIQVIKENEFYLPAHINIRWVDLSTELNKKLTLLDCARGSAIANPQADIEKIKEAIANYAEPLKSFRLCISSDMRSLLGISNEKSNQSH